MPPNWTLQQPANVPLPGRPATGPIQRAHRSSSMEPVFRTLEIAAKTLVAATGTKMNYQNLENIPPRGSAVMAINHTSYVDLGTNSVTLNPHRQVRRPPPGGTPAGASQP